MQRLFQRSSIWTIVVFGVVLLAGLLDLAQPLEGDQSLFLIGAKEMARGAVLYRDFWDLKQPGIYDFFYLAGLLGGFDAFPVHALELGYLLAFSALLTYAISRSAALASGAAVVPLFSVALYFIVASPFEQLQVEALAGFPIFVAAWLACEGVQRTGRMRYVAFFVAGIAAGCALVLKLVFAPLLLALFITAVAVPSGAYRPALRIVLGAVVTYLAGTCIPTLAVLATLAHGGALGAALDTWLAMPPRIVATLPVQNLAILRGAVLWFVRSYGLSVVLGIAGMAAVVRSGNDALARCMAVWIVLGAATILAQRTSWWSYQWLLESVPFGAFASVGIVALVRSPRSLANVAVLALAAVFAISPIRAETRKLSALAKYRLALRSDDRERYRTDASSAYAGMRADAALLPPDASLYVMGNPVYYVTTGRTQPLALNGWSLQLLLPEQRRELLREFTAHPPAYVYISHDDDGPLQLFAKSPAFETYFTRSYRLVAQGTFGTLYRYES